MKPTVLVVATTRWFSTARLVVALADSGFTVHAVCPPRHPLQKTRTLRKAHRYHGLSPLASIRDAIASARTDLLIPADDLATRHLHTLHACERSQAGPQAPICKLIERSLGAPESFPLVYARTPVMELAGREGVRVPKTAQIKNAEELEKCIGEIGLPLVLKTNGSSGGGGVRIVTTLEHARRALSKLQALPLLTTAKRLIADQDTSTILPLLRGDQAVVNAQSYVPGRDATSLVACWKGIVLAGLHFEVLNKQYANGPSSVLRLTENPEIASAAAKLVRRLNLSGLHGFDFVVEQQTQNAYLVEMNPRATQVAHLAVGPGADLTAALYSAITRRQVQERPKLTDNHVITLFPQEWIRNPESVFLRSGYHDVPWEEPDLIRACVRTHRRWSSWYSEQKWMRTFWELGLPRT